MVKLIPLMGAAALIAAAPALATEGPPPAAGPPLPDMLHPVAIPQTIPPAIRTARRVLAAQVTPRRISVGHRSRLRVALSEPGKVRIVVWRMVHGHPHHVWGRTVSAPLSGRILRLPAHLRAGRYRVTAIALDDQGRRAHTVRRTLIVARR
ncbi:hypothetical protein OM076_06525 [Solirubrobacter ginsenosidimutans]|uniref:Uncharacterized protein n=1 Tax=Solirubrobacter ginsenosidimutans TaxID=490573 RepID=A0A9X3MUD6_9ACTN|nr:hypothetical protein [Solirubrobacter ginsenosidimutans]MDA0159908.1 hypothetical protein [Solirubrobacter ginsenosidimutans]